MTDYGPRTVYADQIHAEKYRLPKETFRDAMGRVASALKDSDAHYHAFRGALLEQRFLPAGRVQAAMGSPKAVTPYNCLSGDTLILTREHGSVPIEKVAGSVVTLLDGNGDWVPCSIYDHGEQETVALTFKGGFESLEIRSTLEHGWIAASGHSVVKTKAFVHDSGRKEIADLRPAKSAKNEAQYRLGLVHGLIYGDGTAQSDGAYSIRICSNLECLAPVMADYGFCTPPSYDGDRNYRVPRDSAWCNLKSLPSDPGGDLDYLLGFLRGWFGADGCVSTQPEATICGDADERDWIAQWGPLVGWHVRGSSELSATTNYGERKKKSLNIRLKASSMDAADFLIAKHRERWTQGSSKRGKSWRVHGGMRDRRIERVYCPVVSTTHSFALSSGIHSANCYVSGTIPDSFVGRDNPENSSIMHRAEQAATTMRMGGGIGYNFSTLRPGGALIRKLQSKSSGPLGFMPIFNEVCKATSSAGNRRGAQMGVLNIDHPDILEFISAKHNSDALTGFNISVGVTDKFMESLASGKPFDLTFGGEVYNTVDPQELWEVLMRSTWDWAEPGVLFVDRINEMNNLWYAETISATNPCGEQPLPPFGACLLGSFNLVKYLSAYDGGWHFDVGQLVEDIPHVVRAMDNVVDRAIYPLEEQRQEAHNKRRMGLGVTGLANTAEALGMPYGEAAFLQWEDEVLALITRHTYLASVELAKEKGAFPLFDAERYCAGRFVKTLDQDVQDAIARHGIRNSHLTSIAPTGTISMAADNVSSSIEPVYRWQQERTVLMAAGRQTVDLFDYGFATLNVRGRRTSMGEVTAKQHVDVLTTAQRHIDSAVSKTVNCDKSMPWDEFKGLYIAAYEGGAKGCTTFNKDGKRMGLFKESFEPADLPFPGGNAQSMAGGKVEDVGMSCEFDPATGRRSCE